MIVMMIMIFRGKYYSDDYNEFLEVNVIVMMIMILEVNFILTNLLC